MYWHSLFWSSGAWKDDATAAIVLGAMNVRIGLRVLKRNKFCVGFTWASALRGIELIDDERCGLDTSVCGFGTLRG